MQPIIASVAATKTMHLVAEQQSRFWKCIRPTFVSRTGTSAAFETRQSNSEVFLPELEPLGEIIPITGKQETSTRRRYRLSAFLPSEILKAHRTHHLYHKHYMYNVPIAETNLEAMFRDQLLVRCVFENILSRWPLSFVRTSANVFTASTLVLFVHDMSVSLLDADSFDD